MSADFTRWRIVDKDGNQINITEVLLNRGTITIEATEYDPQLPALDALRQALDELET